MRVDYFTILQGVWPEAEEKKPDVSQFGNKFPVNMIHMLPVTDSKDQMTLPRKVKIDNQGLGGLGKYKHFCAVCKKVFSDKRHLEDHYRSKHGGPKLQCQHCPKTFNLLRSLEMHTPIHTGKYPFRCTQCNAGFNLRRDLQAHENKHQGRGYTCLNCNKVFYVEKELFKHQDRCGKSYEHWY